MDDLIAGLQSIYNPLADAERNYGLTRPKENEDHLPDSLRTPEEQSADTGFEVTLSDEVRALAKVVDENEEISKFEKDGKPDERLSLKGSSFRGGGDKAEETNPDGMTDEEEKQVEDLKQVDREVRAHEQAHLMAAGGLARGGASFEYVTGPDGARYAVGGEVQIDTSEIEGDPDANLAKAQRIQSAALAPADPSAQDRRVAAEASAMAAEARQEVSEEQFEDSRGTPEQETQTIGEISQFGGIASSRLSAELVQSIYDTAF